MLSLGSDTRDPEPGAPGGGEIAWHPSLYIAKSACLPTGCCRCHYASDSADPSAASAVSPRRVLAPSECYRMRTREDP